MTPSSTNYVMLFGRNIRAARIRAGLTQADLAKRTGISLNKVSFIEAGRLAVTIQMAAAMAEAAGCPLPSLLEAASVELTNERVPG